jgi:SAM-dependent methyltransferase
VNDGPTDDRYRELNHANWEARVPLHAASAEYGLDRYVNDPRHLSDVVRFDVPRLGDLTGLDVVHLQCHLGTDTVSLARLGPASTTGLDFSGSALAEARRLAERAKTPVEFVEADLYDAVDALGGERFDVVYTGVGALCWLPDVVRWAEVVAGLLRPGGVLHLREGHPVLWSLDDPRPDGLVVLEFPYFEGPGTTFVEHETYVSHEGALSAPETIAFNHGLGEIVMALLRAGLTLELLEEHDSVPWAALGDQMEELPNGEFRLRDRPERLPHSYTLRARRT